MEKQIKIKNLSDMELVLKIIHEGKDIEVEKLDFSELKPLQVKIYGDAEKYNGTLPSSLCYGLCDFQNELLKTYCLIKYKTDNLRYLKNADRELLEVVFEIKPGCTDLLASLTDFTKACGEAFSNMTQGMSGTQKTACMIVLILSLAGGSLVYTQIEANHDIAVQQIDAKKEEAKSKTENERMIILRDGMLEAMRKGEGTDAQTVAEGIKLHSARAYEGLLKPLTDADKVEINGAAGKVELSQNDIQNYVSNPTQKPEHQDQLMEVEIDGIKRSPDKLTLTCHQIGSESSFIVYVDLSFVEPQEVALLFDAFKKSSAVKIQGNFKVRAGIIEQANLSSVTE